MVAESLRIDKIEACYIVIVILIGRERSDIVIRKNQTVTQISCNGYSATAKGRRVLLSCLVPVYCLGVNTLLLILWVVVLVGDIAVLVCFVSFNHE